MKKTISLFIIVTLLIAIIPYSSFGVLNAYAKAECTSTQNPEDNNCSVFCKGSETPNSSDCEYMPFCDEGENSDDNPCIELKKGECKPDASGWEKACEKFETPDYTGVITEWGIDRGINFEFSGNAISNTEIIESSSPNSLLNYNAGEVLELAHKMGIKYHSFVQCHFDWAENAIFKNDCSASEGTWNTEMTFDWMKWTDINCMSDVKEFMLATKPAELVYIISNQLSQYNSFLSQLEGILDENKLSDIYISNALRSVDNIFQAREIIGTETPKVKRYLNNERSDSKYAINSAWKGLSALREAFVMHVHFMCMMKKLEKYQKALVNIRQILEDFPSRFKDASSVKS